MGKSVGWKMMLLIIFAALVFLWLIKAPILSSYLTSRLKVPVSMGSISIWPSESTIKNFKITNPRGFKLSNALKADQVKIDYQARSLFENPCIIDQISLNDVYLGIEFSSSTGTKNNWTVIGSKIYSEAHSKEVIIHKLILENITVEIKGVQAQYLKLSEKQTISRMEFDEIDSKQGFPTKELIGKIFKEAGLEEILNPEGLIEDLTNPLHFFGADDERGLSSESP